MLDEDQTTGCDSDPLLSPGWGVENIGFRSRGVWTVWRVFLIHAWKTTVRRQFWPVSLVSHRVAPIQVIGVVPCRTVSHQALFLSCLSAFMTETRATRCRTRVIDGLVRHGATRCDTSFGSSVGSDGTKRGVRPRVNFLLGICSKSRFGTLL